MPRIPKLLIAMAGLPGSGKSTLARRLGELLPAVVLDKDTIRAALFPSPEIDYSNRQDDFCVAIMLQTSTYLMDKGRTVILDGRTFTLKYQVDRLVRFSRAAGAVLEIIECICPDEAAYQRLALDDAMGLHIAANRDFGLYQRIKSQAVPIQVPHLQVDTSRPFDECLDTCLTYLRERH
jgi:adenylylsulfate kinase